MERILEIAKEMGQTFFGTGLLDTEYETIVSAGGIVAAAAGAVMAFLMLFFGLKSRYFLYAVQGFITGCLGGFAAGYFLGLRGFAALGAAAGAGLILAVIETVFGRFGTFVFAACVIFGSIVWLTGSGSCFVLAAGGIAALIIAALTVIFGEPVLIPVMGIGGGVLGSTAAVWFLEAENRILLYIICALLAAAGISVQYLRQSRMLEKIEQEKVNKIREKKSVESEIEMARNMLLDEEEATDQDNEREAEDSVSADGTKEE